MPRDLFGDVTRPSISVGNRKWYTVPLSLCSHSAIVLILIALPILAPAAMPSVFADDGPTWTSIVAPPPPPPPRLPTDQPKRQPLSDLAPIIAPDTIAPEPPQREWRETESISVITGDVFNGSDELVPPPPPQKPAAQQRVRAVFTVRTPMKLRHVDPVYPPIAQSARVQGIVIIEATIGEDGQVIDARILRSVPLLDQAALDAVRQWQFTPSILNGVPVPVIMTVTVNFTLK